MLVGSGAQGSSYKFVLQQKGLEGYLSKFEELAVIGLLVMAAVIIYDVVVKVVELVKR